MIIIVKKKNKKLRKPNNYKKNKTSRENTNDYIRKNERIIILMISRLLDVIIIKCKAPVHFIFLFNFELSYYYTGIVILKT